MSRSVFAKLLGALALFACAAASAHEFWIRPSSFSLPVGATVSLSLHVGENFTGETVAIHAALLSGFSQFAAGNRTELRDQVPSSPAAEVRVRLQAPGSHLIAIDTQPVTITLPADKFHAYLHEEGLDTIIKAREAAGSAASPGRERYRRNIGTLLQAGNRSDAIYSLRTGQRLQLLPLADPFRHQPGKDIGFQLLFEGRPVANRLVKFWHQRDKQIWVARTITSAEGKVAFTPPWTGVWMASAVHMIAATDTVDSDWDSFWANLTFSLPAQSPKR